MRNVILKRKNLENLISIKKLEFVEDKTYAFQNELLFKYKKENCINYVFNNGKAMRYLTYLEFPPNIERGKHFHQYKEENLLVLKGNLRVTCWKVGDEENKLKLDLSEGEIITIKPMCVHSYYSTKGASAIEFSSKKLNYKDQIKV